jgi:hypothetical protein
MRDCGTARSADAPGGRHWQDSALPACGTEDNPGGGHWKDSVIQAVFTARTEDNPGGGHWKDSVIQACGTARTEDNPGGFHWKDSVIQACGTARTEGNPGGGHCCETRVLDVRPRVGSGKRKADGVKELLSTVTVFLVSEHSTINTFFVFLTKFRY